MNNNNFLKPTDEFRNYKALEEIEKNPSISQRDLANKLGVALGIANSCVHTLIKKGLIKIRGENNRSITYHLTNKGLLHKSILALEWTKNTIGFYREARDKISSRLVNLKKQNINSVFIYKTNELAEITAIVAPESGIEILGFIEPDINRQQFKLGLPITNLDFLNVKIPDAVIICADLDERDRQHLMKICESNIKLVGLTQTNALEGIHIEESW